MATRSSCQAFTLARACSYYLIRCIWPPWRVLHASEGDIFRAHPESHTLSCRTTKAWISERYFQGCFWPWMVLSRLPLVTSKGPKTWVGSSGTYRVGMDGSQVFKYISNAEGWGTKNISESLAYFLRAYYSSKCIQFMSLLLYRSQPHLDRHHTSTFHRST